MQTNPAVELAGGTLVLLASAVAIDPVARQWLEENIVRMGAVGGFAALVAIGLILISPDLPTWRVGIGRVLLATLGGGMLAAVGGSVHSAGGGIAWSVFSILLGGAGAWVFVLSLQEYLLEKQRSGSIKQAIAGAIPGALSRVLSTIIPTNPPPETSLVEGEQAARSPAKLSSTSGRQKAAHLKKIAADVEIVMARRQEMAAINAPATEPKNKDA